MRRWITTLVVFTVTASMASAARRPNVLFIAVDDLRPQINCYGKTFMHTPHLDRLAERGVLFERAYCMVPTCGASRASLMSGIRPAPDRFVNYLAWAEKDVPGVTTLNTHFKNHGYTTISLGKVFHHATDNVDGWSETPWRPQTGDYHNKELQAHARAEHRKKYPQRKAPRGMPYEQFDAPDESYRDAENASKAITHMKRFARQKDVPFFLAVGFYKPHLPFCAPQKYWDLYDASKIDVPHNYRAPEGAPAVALHSSGELRAYASIPPKGPVARETARQLIHGYYACVSFIDAQVGRLLDALDDLGLTDNTIIVLWGDHGWQLGEHGMWNKHSCFETSMHAPLLVAAPGESGVKPGTRVRALTEFIDIYPSLCDLAGLPKPEHLEGRSFLPLMKDPGAPWKSYAVGRFKSGDTIRSDRYRFSEYPKGSRVTAVRMLYDHSEDPDETVNVSERDGNSDTVRELARELHARKGKPGAAK
ncbi:MAG: sulfatase [Planctomycetes bacterium]|nr:sulfatase [Planctomycetota bacterium]